MKRNLKLDTREFVCPHIFDEYGEDAVIFVDEKLVEALTWLKENFYKDHEIICNEYPLEAGSRTTRDATHHGMICNKCALSVAHTFKLEVFATDQVLGKAAILKFTINGVTRKADEVVNELLQMSPTASESLFKITVPIYAHKINDELVFLSVREDRTGGELVTQLNLTPEEKTKLRKRIVTYSNAVYSGDGYSGNYGAYSGTSVFKDYTGVVDGKFGSKSFPLGRGKSKMQPDRMYDLFHTYGYGVDRQTKRTGTECSKVIINRLITYMDQGCNTLQKLVVNYHLGYKDWDKAKSDIISKGGLKDQGTGKWITANDWIRMQETYQSNASGYMHMPISSPASKTRDFLWGVTTFISRQEQGVNSELTVTAALAELGIT